METMETREDILSRIIESVVDGDREGAKEMAQAALDACLPPMVTVTEGFARAMQIVGEKYDEKEFFVPEVLVAAKAMEAGVKVLKPHLEGGQDEQKGKVTICTIQGDVHDLGKNIVALMLRMYGYDVNDLGRDVPISTVIEGAKKQGADVIAVSALMTTSMRNMQRLIDALEEEGLRDRFKIAVGGAPISQLYCDAIGADIYAEDAVDAVKAIGTVLSGGQGVARERSKE
jgi:5-methyltetrahydrofolate--homocysteine methyltransferase